MKNKLIYLRMIRALVIVVCVYSIVQVGYFAAKGLVVNAITQKKNVELPKSFSILLAGTDVDGGGVRDVDKDGIRTDALMLATFNPKNERGAASVNVISIPRDTLTYVPCLGAETKITEAASYGYNNGFGEGEPQTLEAAIACTKESVSMLMDTEIDYYIAVNFNTFIKLIDAVGGVEMTWAQESVREQDSKGNKDVFFFEKGKTYNMNGEMALAYARNRYGSTAAEREMRQQQLISAIIAKVAKEPEKYATKIAPILATDTTNNISIDFVLNLAQYAANLYQNAMKLLSYGEKITLDIVDNMYAADNLAYNSFEVLGLNQNNIAKQDPSKIYDKFQSWEEESNYIYRVLVNKDMLNVPSGTPRLDKEGKRIEDIKPISLEVQMLSPTYEDFNDGVYYSIIPIEELNVLRQSFDTGRSYNGEYKEFMVYWWIVVKN
ncbi:MAG: LCP family protein [Mycoplasmatales bacterium]